MRKLLLAALGLGLAGAVLPASSASAVCWQAYYEITGSCSPCGPVAGAWNSTGDRVETVSEKFGLGVGFADMHCLA